MLKKLSRPTKDRRGRRAEAGENLLNHRGCLAEDSDAGGDVQQDDRPQQVELPGFHRIADRDSAGAFELGGFGFVFMFRRDPEHERADDHGDEIHAPHDDERLPDSDGRRGCKVIHERGGHRRGDDGASSESHHREPGCHAPAMRKPADQGCDGRGETETETHPSDNSVADVEKPDLVQKNAERREEKPAAETERRDKAAHARADALLPRAAETRRQTEKDVGEREHPSERGEVPIIGRRLGDPDNARQRDVEDAERVRLSDAEIDEKRRRYVPPAVVAGLGNDAVLRKNAHWFAAAK